MGHVRRHRPPIVEDGASCRTLGGGENKGMHTITADEIYLHELRPACRCRPLHPAPLKVHEQGNPAINFGHLLSTQLPIPHIVTKVHRAGGKDNDPGAMENAPSRWSLVLHVLWELKRRKGRVLVGGPHPGKPEDDMHGNFGSSTITFFTTQISYILPYYPHVLRIWYILYPLCKEI